MVDFDVAAVGLDSPPAEAYKQACRPAISTKNNGVSTVKVTGHLTIIFRTTGLQVFSSPIQRAALNPGATGAVQALADWTPAAEGYYLAYGFVSTVHDSVPQNNNLAPVQFHVGPGTPPPPVVVPAHAGQHENGGSDELAVDGLTGKLADVQDPDTHVASHQLGGGDQINVAGLSGELASPQVPKAHSNSYHVPVLATSAELTAHQGATAAHSAATNLANRETSGGDSGLVKSVQLAAQSEVIPGRKFLELGSNPGDRKWSVPVPTGLICLFPSATPIPAGWQAAAVLPAPLSAHAYIEKT